MNARRRWVAAGVALSALAWAGALRAQGPAPLVIGWLSTGTEATGRTGRATFSESMAALGWKLDAQYVFEARAADGRVERLPALAQEIAARKPAVIVAFSSAAASAATAASPTTPVVLANGDPLASGLVASLARPEGMITGLSNVLSDTNLKTLELLVESLPKLQRVGFLIDSTATRRDARVSEIHRVAERMRIAAVIVDLAKPEDIEPAFVQLAKGKAQAVVVGTSSWVQGHTQKIIQLALAQRWPVVGPLPRIPRQGGLLSYGADESGLIKRSATYVDRILKGAKPGELPIEQPTNFALVLNVKTAKQLGISIPASVRLRATEVIE